MHRKTGGWLAVFLVGSVLPMAMGCRVEQHDGQGKDVSIDTPMGGLHVKTDPATVLTKVGLPAYPGAKPVTESEQHKHSADVNLSFGSFKLQVLATALQTADRPAQVEAFYRKALSQYSEVIACRDQQPVGTPARTGMGLTCSDDKHVHTASENAQDDDRNDLELKAGSPSRQHIVALKQSGDQTRMELISLELPHGDRDN